MRTADGRVGTARRGMVAGALHTSACAVLHESTNSIVKPRTMLMSGCELVVLFSLPLERCLCSHPKITRQRSKGTLKRYHTD